MDTIVNTTSKELILDRGTLSKSIVDSAGTGLQDECNALKLSNLGDVVVTKGHNLPCRFVCHGAGAIWDGPKGKTSQKVN